MEREDIGVERDGAGGQVRERIHGRDLGRE